VIEMGGAPNELSAGNAPPQSIRIDTEETYLKKYVLRLDILTGHHSRHNRRDSRHNHNRENDDKHTAHQ